MVKLFEGRRTYAAAVVMVALAAAQFAGVAVPPEVWLLLNGLGLGFLRAAIPRL